MSSTGFGAGETPPVYLTPAAEGVVLTKGMTVREFGEVALGGAGKAEWLARHGDQDLREYVERVGHAPLLAAFQAVEL